MPMMVVDTNVVSEAMSATPDERVLAWFSAQYHPDIFATSITVAEILYGIELLPAGKRRSGLWAAAEITFAKFLPSTIMPHALSLQSRWPAGNAAGQSRCLTRRSRRLRPFITPYWLRATSPTLKDAACAW
jgi:hypothetical protein